jgi:6-phosphofructokinase
MNNIKRIAINTGGGNAPGLNAVILAAVHAAFRLISHGSGGPSLTR